MFRQMASEAEATAMSQRDLEAIDETSNVLIRNSRCCFIFPCFNSRRQSSSAAGVAWWQRVQSHDRWWAPAVAAFQRVREWSEIVAGPKWKTFIRRFNRNRSGNSHSHHGKFQYDPLSYSLNFEEDSNFDNDDEFTGFRRDFSSRYASSKLASTAAAVAAVDSRGKDVAVHSWRARRCEPTVCYGPSWTVFIGFILFFCVITVKNRGVTGIL